MAARKLQTEIDRTLKKVGEGVELFESIYDKMQSSTNQTQKEKLETDLKTQIKKLQRLRDQIKTWVASNDIKDKSQLMDNRKLIETQMERFKACEKEMKTKAFSKEGLIASQKMDPKEREKLEVSDWISSILAELERQVEQTEAEIVALQAPGKKKKSTATSRSEELQQIIDRRKWHMGRLEIVLRLVNNGTIAPEDVVAIKEDVNYFVESNVEEDFEENEFIYDDLNLDEQEEAFRIHNEENGHSDDDMSMISGKISDPPLRPIAKEKMKSPSHDEPPTSPVMKKQPVAPRKPVEKPEPPKPPVPTTNFAAQPMSAALKAGLPQTAAPVKPVLPPMRYAAAAGGSAAVPATNGTTQAAPASATASIPPPTPASIRPSLPSQATASVAQSSPPGSPSAVSMSVSVSSPVLSSAAPPSHAVDTSSANGSYYQDSRVQSPEVSTSEAIVSPVVPSVTPASLMSGAEAVRSNSTEAIPAVNGASKDVSTISQHASGDTQNVPRTAPPPGIIPISVVRSGSTSESQTALAPTGPPPNLSRSPLPQQVQQISTIASTTASSSRLESTEPAQSQPQTATSGSYALGPTDGVHQQQQPPVGQVQRPIGMPAQARPPTAAPGSQIRSNLPGSLGDLVSSFEVVKQKAAQRMANPDQMHKILEVAMNGTPQPADTEKPKYYVPRSQYNTPPYYPQTPLQSLSSPQLFAQLDVETLFYVFYFLPGTYQQYLAAQQLKTQSWRFHVKYLTWFQRHSEPQAITEEYEQGVYVYFDWEGSWCQRKKSDFRFEYRYLSDD
ncbi:general negative regulator of transcription subunit 5 [Tulasnella sp. 332]|nr:general negative regulator of transcription subunit 5 [Tulasnella sp. 332]